MSSYETCHHGKCTTYPGWNECPKCEKELQEMLEKAGKAADRKTYHLLRYAIGRMSLGVK